MLRSVMCMLGLLGILAQAQADSQEPVPEQVPPGKAAVLTTAYGTPFDAYINGPADAGKGVLLLHDRYGLNQQAHDWVDRFAGLGYRAVAIDLYDGRRGNNWKHATSIMASIDQVWADSDIAAALDYLKKDHPDRKVVIVGWDYGATQAMAATLHDPTAVAATVAYYPTHLETDPAVVQSIVNPVLIVVAERDQELSTEQVVAFKDGLSKTRVDFNVMGLDADRAFSDPANDHYDAAATATVWDVTQEFLARYLGP
jgi:carboxymethylenebutenolidase